MNFESLELIRRFELWVMPVLHLQQPQCVHMTSHREINSKPSGIRQVKAAFA